ncbi:MAG: PAS domain-containing protein, partial [Bacteroidota bacterium]|nr:PAS domain-containing protein [Bacteroidota bacterium]
WNGEFINQKKDGTEFYEHAIITPIKNDKGEITDFLAIKEDITELKKAQQRIEEKTKQQQILINNLPAHIYFKNKNLKYLLVNNSYAQLLNHSNQEIVGKTDDDVSPAEIAEMYQKIDREIIQSKTPVFNYEEKHIGNDGEEYWASTSKVPYFDENNNVIGIVGIVQDVTERKNQNQLIIEKNQQITIAHKNITDSINYAKRIQNALLPTQELENELLKEHFILFLPKENVSGDFYYVYKNGDNLLFAAADCTGHGVSGGFMTMLSITFLNEIIKRDKVTTPSNILEQLRRHIKGIFSQFGTEIQNGLDIAFCSVDTKTNILQYAGAYNPLWIVRNNELLEYKATRNPIGFYPKEKEFKNHEIQLQNNDLIYVFSDGYQDQFGREGKRKFTKKRFKNKLMEIHKLPLSEQRIILTKTLQDWKNGREQIDDIVVMGIKWIIK